MPTDNHGLNTPSKGSTDWHIPLNDNFSSLDSILKNISTDGTTFSPSDVTTDEITLNGSTRTSWDALDSTDPTTVGDKVIIAETASEIQTAIDTLDGTKTGYDSDGNADTPGGGVVLLKRKEYFPESPIILRRGVQLVGLQPDRRKGRNNFTWTYSVINGKNISEGNPIIKTPNVDDPDKQAEHASLRNIVISGHGRHVHGVKIHKASNSWLKNVLILKCAGHAYWVRGGQATYVESSVIQGGDTKYGTYACLIQSENDSVGSGSKDTQINIRECNISSAGAAAPSGTDRGNTALYMDSSQLRVSGKTRIVTQNTETPGIAAFYNSQRGTTVRLWGVTMNGHQQSGVHGIRNKGTMRIANSRIEKFDTGILGDMQRMTYIANSRIAGNSSHGINITQNAPALTNVKVDSNDGDGIHFGGGFSRNPWANIDLFNNGGWQLNTDNIHSDKIPFCSGFHIGTGGNGGISSPGNAWLRIGRHKYTNEDYGEFSGSGTSSSPETMTVSHHMSETPTWVTITPKNAGAAGDWYLSNATSSDFDITFTDAPSDGEPCSFRWHALGPSAVRYVP